MLKCLHKNKGATLVEMLVIMAIIASLTLMVVPNYRSGNSQLALQRSANKLAQDIRRAEEKALSAEVCLPCGGTVPSYGIYLEEDEKDYILYADRNGDQKYTPADEEIERPDFEEGVYIQTITSSNNKAGINFSPPEPAIDLDVVPGGADSVTITLALETDPSKTKLIIVNRAGLISVE